MRPMTIHNPIAAQFYKSCQEMATAYDPRPVFAHNREGRTVVYRDLLDKYQFDTVWRHTEAIAKILEQIEEYAWHEEVTRWLNM